MVEQISDAMRHLEKDMADILEVMSDKQTTEVILNPYRCHDGSYEGHILVDQHGRGLHNLIRYSESVIEPAVLKVGDTVLYKYSKQNPETILFWVDLSPSPMKLHKQLGPCIKSFFAAEHIYQSEDVAIIKYAEAIENKYALRTESNLSSQLDEIIADLNLHNPATSSCEFAYTTVTEMEECARFREYPAKLIKSELVKMSATKAETIMSVLASITGKFIHNKSPQLECQIPKYGHRFTGVISPVVSFPAFCIRKHAPKVYSLDDFVQQGVMEASSRDTIISWIKRKFNILIAGGTGSGKTTLANAILHEIARLFPETRVLIIEDVPELQFNTSRSIGFNIGEFFSMYDALRTTLRFKPDRIVMGEVRGAEAYTLLKAWNTGHPGGLATIHANGVNEALYRFESCVRDHPEVKINRQEIGFTINGIISIQNITLKQEENGEYRNIVRRKVTALRQVLQYDTEKDVYQDIIYDKIAENL